MKNSIMVLGVLAILVVGVGTAIWFWPTPAVAPVSVVENLQITPGLEVYAPIANTLVSNPLSISGKVNGQGWIGFEGQVGTVEVLDAGNNQLAFGILMAKGEWMQQEIQFETTVTFFSPGPSQGKLVFHNENPSADPDKEKTFILPINFQ